jgi:alpha-1,2-mannosyltransferase
LMVWTPIDLMPKHHEVTAALWRQLAGVSYLWWALATLIAAGATAAVGATALAAPRPSTAPTPATAVS